MYVVDLAAQSLEEIPGDGIAGGRPVELEDTDVTGVWGGEVRYADERLGGGGGVAPVEDGGDGLPCQAQETRPESHSDCNWN